MVGVAVPTGKAPDIRSGRKNCQYDGEAARGIPFGRHSPAFRADPAVPFGMAAQSALHTSPQPRRGSDYFPCQADSIPGTVSSRLSGRRCLTSEYEATSDEPDSWGAPRRRARTNPVRLPVPDLAERSQFWRNEANSGDKRLTRLVFSDRRSERMWPVAPSAHPGCRSRSPGLQRRAAGTVRCHLAEANEREVAERRHMAALDQMHLGVTLGPLREPRPGKFGTPAEAARERREARLERTTEPALGADVVDQHDLAAALEHAREFVERRLQIGRAHV